AGKITGLGIDTTAEEVTTSAQVLAERLAERFGPGARVHLLGTTGLRVALETAGLQITDTVDEAPVAIAQGLDPDIDYEKIVLACRIIRSGAEWWASNPDYSLLTEIGRVPGNGAFVDLISRLTETEPIIVGKTAPHIMEFAAGPLGAHRPPPVGARPDPDSARRRPARWGSATGSTPTPKADARPDSTPPSSSPESTTSTTPWPPRPNVDRPSSCRACAASKPSSTATTAAAPRSKPDCAGPGRPST